MQDKIEQLQSKLGALNLALKQCKANDKPNAKRRRRIRGYELGIKHTQLELEKAMEERGT